MPKTNVVCAEFNVNDRNSNTLSFGRPFGCPIRDHSNLYLYLVRVDRKSKYLDDCFAVVHFLCWKSIRRITTENRTNECMGHIDSSSRPICGVFFFWTRSYSSRNVFPQFLLYNRRMNTLCIYMLETVQEFFDNILLILFAQLQVFFDIGLSWRILMSLCTQRESWFPKSR